MSAEDIVKLLGDLEMRLTQTITASENKLMDNINNKFEKFELKLAALETKSHNNSQNIALNTIQTQAAIDLGNSTKNTVIDLRTDIDALTVSNAELVKEVADLNKTVAEQAIKVHVHTQRSENLANRTLRKTIEIRGVPEPVEEVSWEATRAAAAQSLAVATGLHANRIGDWFERIHRGPKNDQHNKYPRKIYASFYDWNRINELTSALRLNGRNSGIYIDQKYGPDTSYRRSKAFMKRKEANTIVSGFVKFPAKLLVKYGKDSKYVLCEDFSTVPIPDEVYNK